MRKLTFQGFLKQYVQELSLSGTTSFYKLGQEAATVNPRLCEPLLLYALYTGNVDLLFRATRGTPLNARYLADVKLFANNDPGSVLSRSDIDFSREYKKVWKSYESEANRTQADNQTKHLIRTKVLRLQAQKGITTYRLYKDLGLNPGNINAWIKHDDNSKLSLETARSVLRYIESR